MERNAHLSALSWVSGACSSAACQRCRPKAALSCQLSLSKANMKKNDPTGAPTAVPICPAHKGHDRFLAGSWNSGKQGVASSCRVSIHFWLLYRKLCHTDCSLAGMHWGRVWRGCRVTLAVLTGVGLILGGNLNPAIYWMSSIGMEGVTLAFWLFSFPEVLDLPLRGS